MQDDALDPVLLTKKLISFPSISPDVGPCQSFIKDIVRSLGFKVEDMTLGEGPQKTANFFASLGQGRPRLCFAGHSDVVPVGEKALWDGDPFEAFIREGKLVGRGACDMKGNIAAFLAALARLHREKKLSSSSVSLLITGDEEAKGTNGTKKLLPRLQQEALLPDFCIVGEPTSQKKAGDTIKVGRRGSLNVTLTIKGVQGHVAYPHKADNPIHRLNAILADLIDQRWDKGNRYFQASSLQVTSIDVGNTATNVTPSKAVARFNMRFNNAHSGKSLEEAIQEIAYRHALPQQVVLDFSLSGEAFITHPGKNVEALRRVITATAGYDAQLDTGGGTSDARFLSQYCPTIELGVVGSSLHKVNEYVAVDDLYMMTDIYKNFIEKMEM